MEERSSGRVNRDPARDHRRDETPRVAEVERRVPPAPPIPHDVSSDLSSESLRAAAEQPMLYAGRYELVGLLGVGGMGSVYRVRDIWIDEHVALKILRKDQGRSNRAVERFFREARLSRRVTHRNVIRIYDIGQLDDETYLTMECVDGDSLGAILVAGQALDLVSALDVAHQVALGLDAAHNAGVIHCDLKPENILVSRDGRVVLSDFGVAAERDLQLPTLPGQAGGTPVYMSPEQIEGRVLDFRTDLYALGILLYEMLTGSPPWSRDRGTMSASVARLSVPAPDPRTKNEAIPESVAKFVLQLLEREPANRPASAGDVANRLGDMLETGRSTPVPSSSARPPRRSSLAPSQLATTNTPHTRGVAVMTLRNLGDEKTAYVAEAVTDELSNHLAKATGLRVASRLSAQMRDGEDLRTFGARLNVQAVVEGSLLVKPDGSMRLTVRLTEVERGFSLFSTRVDRKADDLFSIAQEIATKVAEALTVEASSDGPAPAAKAAVDPFLRARRAYGVRTHAGAQEAASLLEEGLARSPKDPLLLSWLALAKLQLWEFEPSLGESGSIRREVRRLAEGVLSNDATSGEAHLALAVLLAMQADPLAATTAANEAVRCNPTLGEAHLLLGRIHSESGRLAEGIHRLALALRIDPKSTVAPLELARTSELSLDQASADAWLTLADERARDRSEPALLRMRIAFWRGKAAPLSEARVRGGRALRDASGGVAVLLRLFFTDNYGPTIDVAKALAATPGMAPRARVYVLTLVTERLALAGDIKGAVSMLRSARDAGLLDLLWLDKCPALDPLRLRTDFMTIVSDVRAVLDPKR